MSRININCMIDFQANAKIIFRQQARSRYSSQKLRNHYDECDLQNQ